MGQCGIHVRKITNCPNVFMFACRTILRQYLFEDGLNRKAPSHREYRNALRVLINLGMVDEALSLVFDNWQWIKKSV